MLQRICCSGKGWEAGGQPPLVAAAAGSAPLAALDLPLLCSPLFMVSRCCSFLLQIWTASGGKVDILVGGEAFLAEMGSCAANGCAADGRMGSCAAHAVPGCVGT